MLPPLQAAWLADLLGGDVPDETRATCSSCVMCEGVAPGGTAFNPATKCCTYVPDLPNFLVGGVLASRERDDAAVAGRESVRRRIAAGVGVSPLGLARSERDLLLYRHGAGQGFGHSLALRCPHYVEEGGRCGVWRHRNGVCSTWFCKYVRGEAGRAFWERAQQCLSQIEHELSTWCVLELDLGADALAAIVRVPPLASAQGAQLSASDLDGRRDPAADRAWGRWSGRREELYVACAELVGGLSTDDVVAVCGPETRALVEVLRQAWRRTQSTELPRAARLGSLQIAALGETTCRVTAYSGHDPVEMPRALFDALAHFDGRPLDEARAAIVRAGGPELTDGLVRKLVDFGVLVAEG